MRFYIPCKILLFLITAVLLFFGISEKAEADKILYAEQYYKLYHQNFYQYPEDFKENIGYLEKALSRPFVNPLNALGEIEDKKEWERYRYLFSMHLNLELVKQYRLWGAKYDKRRAYFFNEPWKEQNLESLEIAESLYEAALHYWNEALVWWARVEKTEYRHIEEIQYWEDERKRIETGDLDYADIIAGDLERLREVRLAFESMDENTY
ncbi:MAG: hypothetical protein ACOC2B_03120 [Sediminispirochaetaceae bacterium]